MIRLTVFLLIAVSLVKEQWASTNTYQRHSGWSQNGGEVTFDCDDGGHKEAEIWVSDTSYPPTTEKLTLKNCQNLKVSVANAEKHLQYVLNSLTVQNVSSLEITGFRRTYEYYPDDPYSRRQLDHWGTFEKSSLQQVPVYTAWFPRVVNLENIANIRFNVAPELKTQSKPLTSTQNFTIMTMKNVVIDNLPEHSIASENAEHMEWKNVTIKNWAAKAVNITGTYASLNFEDCILGEVPENAMMLKVMKVNINKCTISGLKSKSTFVEATDFVFNGNTVGQLEKGSIDIVSSRSQITDNDIGQWHSKSVAIKSTDVDISNNRFQFLGESALENLKTSPKGVQSSFSFVNNTVQQISRSSFDLTWQPSFDNVIFDNNGIDCSCKNVEWFASLSELPKPDYPIRQKIADEQLLESNNFCLNKKSCQLMNVVTAFKQLCGGKVIDDDCYSDSVPNSNVYKSDSMTDALNGIQNLLMVNNHANVKIMNALEKMTDFMARKTKDTEPDLASVLSRQKSSAARYKLFHDFASRYQNASEKNNEVFFDSVAKFHNVSEKIRRMFHESVRKFQNISEMNNRLFYESVSRFQNSTKQNNETNDGSGVRFEIASTASASEIELEEANETATNVEHVQQAVPPTESHLRVFQDEVDEIKDHHYD